MFSCVQTGSKFLMDLSKDLGFGEGYTTQSNEDYFYIFNIQNIILECSLADRVTTSWFYFIHFNIVIGQAQALKPFYIQPKHRALLDLQALPPSLIPHIWNFSMYWRKVRLGQPYLDRFETRAVSFGRKIVLWASIIFAHRQDRLQNTY